MSDGIICLDRIRFEHFYNGVLTFDIHHCTYDCIFCFSKKWRYEFEKNKDNIFEIKLNNLEFDSDFKRIKLKEESRDQEYIDSDFGPNERHNNLINRDKIGECIISTNPEELVKKIEEIFIKIDKNLKLIRFSGGELTHEDFIELLNDFLEYFYKNEKLKNVKFLVETSGYRFSMNFNDRFLSILKNFNASERIHIRISLKNPIWEFYEVLTKNGKRFNLENAIDFGIYCFKNKIDFHYCMVANYLSVYDLSVLKEKLLKKLETTNSKDNENDFFNIFNNIEFERLFYYETLFKEYIIADKILKHNNFSEELYNFIFKDKKWTKNYQRMDSMFQNKIFTNTHEAYYDKYYERTIPRFQKDFNTPFKLDLKQHKSLKKLIKEHILDGFKPKRNLKFLIPRREKKFNGYIGIQEFWELFLHSRYLLYHNRNETLPREFEFKDVSILNKLPLYPGIFYVFDFWHQAHPNYFIHSLYAEREFFKISITEGNVIKNYYVFSLNCNPWSHAHTDISKSIPFIIENTQKNKELIDRIISQEVVDVGSLVLSISDIRNYIVEYRDFSLNIPFYILRYKEVDNIKVKSTPFLGSIAALYNDVSMSSKYFVYLNYFFWTGINKEENKENYSIKKAIDYLEKFQRLGGEEKDPTFFKLLCFEPKMFLLEELKADKNLSFKDLFIKLNMKNEEDIDDFLEKVSKEKETILKKYQRSEN